jgi:hypothetical protein
MGALSLYTDPISMKEYDNIRKTGLNTRNLEQLEQRIEVSIRKGCEWLFQASILVFSSQSVSVNP